MTKHLFFVAGIAALTLTGTHAEANPCHGGRFQGGAASQPPYRQFQNNPMAGRNRYGGNRYGRSQYGHNQNAAVNRSWSGRDRAGNFGRSWNGFERQRDGVRQDGLSGAGWGRSTNSLGNLPYNRTSASGQ